MNTEFLIHTEQAVQRKLPPIAWWKLLRASEDLVVALALAFMVMLPVAEVFLRKLFHVGISGSTAFVQHLVLFIGMLGGAAAARQGRLLSLATTTYLKGRWKTGASVFSNAFAAAMTALLFSASVQFVLSRKESGETLAYGIPLWLFQLVLPIGFGLVTVRLIQLASTRWQERVVAIFLAGTLVCLGVLPPVDPAMLVLPALAVLGIATLLGAPVFVTLGGAALILFWGNGQTIAMIPIDHYRLVVNPTLPTIPLFTLAGYFLAEGGASKRLVRVFQALFGGLRGGPAVVTALVCAFFTSFTGASGVTILALGGLLMPVLIAEHYSEKHALGLLTGAGSLGLLFPPCLPLILYAVVATSVGTEVSIKHMFLGGIGPGLVMLALTAWWGIRKGPGEVAAPRKFDGAEAFSAVWSAKWELALPVVALIALFGGFATPVEAAAVTALYAFAVETFIHRDLKLFGDVPRVMTECGLMVGGVLLILGVAMGLTDYLFDARVPERAVDWAQSALHSRWMFLLALNLFLLIVGCLMDIFSAIVVVAPLIIPMGRAFGIDPVHLGIIFLANLELGYLTPPVGMNLFLSSYRFGKPMGEVIRAVLPMLLILLLGVLLTTYCPPLTTALPRLFP
jgi:C4-dicarboxylate transporter DctM subunit